jgi:hypothetical protein
MQERDVESSPCCSESCTKYSIQTCAERHRCGYYRPLNWADRRLPHETCSRVKRLTLFPALLSPLAIPPTPHIGLSHELFVHRKLISCQSLFSPMFTTFAISCPLCPLCSRLLLDRLKSSPATLSMVTLTIKYYTRFTTSRLTGSSAVLGCKLPIGSMRYIRFPLLQCWNGVLVLELTIAITNVYRASHVAGPNAEFTMSAAHYFR